MKLWKTTRRRAAALCWRRHRPAPRRREEGHQARCRRRAALYYLPLASDRAARLLQGAGLNVEINDFKGGSQSLTALVGGSADVVTGAYEHTLRMQAKGQDIRRVIELGRYPGIALAVKKDRADKIKTIADLKGAKIGVTAPGSSTNMIAGI
jgi:NitT/TauT family transport system substrate-binding protein